MARHVRLADLIPDGDDPDTIEMADGRLFLLPEMGINEMGRLLNIEEMLGGDGADTLTSLKTAQSRVMRLLQAANPDGDQNGKKLRFVKDGELQVCTDYDLTVTQLMELIAVFSGAEGGAVEAVQLALLNEESSSTARTAEEAAKELSDAAGTTDEGDEAPLGSAKPSRKRSSRSASSAAGGRSGGKTSAGRRSSSSSKKSSASKRA